MTDPRQFTENLGGKWYRSYGTAPCPACQFEARKNQNALTINARDGRLLLHCKKAGCDFRDILAAAGVEGQTQEFDPTALLEMERERELQLQKKLQRARGIWSQGLPIEGTHAETYLRGRVITCALPDSLRWLPDTYHTPSGAFCSAMVADVSTGGIHRTFFTKKGERLPQSAKMMLGPCGGGAVRLSESSGPLVVCEGIETGLSLLSGLLSGPASVWAALSTSGIKSLTLPPTPRELIIATDSDDSGAGHAAGNRLASDASARGWKVSLMPAPDGMDWSDVLQSKVQEGAV